MLWIDGMKVLGLASIELAPCFINLFLQISYDFHLLHLFVL